MKAEVVDEDKFDFGKDVCGVLVQYPDTTGSINDYKVTRMAGVGNVPVLLTAKLSHTVMCSGISTDCCYSHNLAALDKVPGNILFMHCQRQLLQVLHLALSSRFHDPLLPV